MFEENGLFPFFFDIIMLDSGVSIVFCTKPKGNKDSLKIKYTFVSSISLIPKKHK